MARRWLLVLVLIGGAVRVARADQCAWIDPAVAQRALAIVRQHARFVSYCEPCHDAAPGAPQAVASAAVDAVPDEAAQGLASLYLDGEEQDLAYTFVEVAPGRFENLAALAGCPAVEVSRVLHLDAGPAPGIAAVASPPAPPPLPRVAESAPSPPVAAAPAPETPRARGPRWPVWFETGFAVLRDVPGAPADAARTSSPAGARAIDAPAVRFRGLVGLGGRIYAGEQLDLGRYRGPGLAAPGAGAASGSIVQGELVLGVHERSGDVTLAEEVGSGIRALDGPVRGDALVIDVRGRLDVWLAPKVSLGLDGAVDVADTRDVSAGLVIAFHGDPFDGLR